jgi:hypothetical protein
MELDLLPNLKIRIAGFLFSPQSGGESDPYSIETQASIPSIPWAKVIGMRNRLIHEYDAIDLAVI